MSLEPTAGARFLFERERVADDGAWAEYRASIHAPGRRLDYAARLALGEPPAIEPRGDTDAALENQLAAIAKQVVRAAGKNRDEGAPPWPRRVLRWKGPGRGG